LNFDDRRVEGISAPRHSTARSKLEFDPGHGLDWSTLFDVKGGLQSEVRHFALSWAMVVREIEFSDWLKNCRF
jgi:hypothetical protein